MIQIDIGDGLTNDQIVELVTEHDTRKYDRNLRYYNGENPTIMDRRLPKVDAPNYKLPVSYARKIVKTVVGYMYKPGLISYNIEDEAYKALLNDVFLANNENTKTSVMGRQASIQGVGYELHYTKGTMPMFAKVSTAEVVPIYNFAIEPEMVAVIRHYRRGEGQNIDVYYADRVDSYYLDDRAGKKGLRATGSEPHQYETVPFVVYENNEEHVGDFEPVLGLIDAYDILLSDSMNEFDRFAWAYLILKNMGTTPSDVKEIKYKRIIELFDNGDAKFLQKDIPSQYIQFMSEWIRKEIHKQAHVPDFTDSTIGTEMTGAAIDRLFYDFEFVAADKEDLFRDALKKRIGLINTILSKSRLGGSIGSPDDVDIVMDRNKPQMLNEMAETMNMYSGVISRETLIDQFAPFTDAETEAERKEGEADPYRGIDAGLTVEQPQDIPST